jgi:hypothetical protein
MISPRRSFLGWSVLAGSCGRVADKNVRLFRQNLAALHELPAIPRNAVVSCITFRYLIPELRRSIRPKARVDDIGYLFVREDRLRFVGEAVSFNLSRSDLRNVRPGNRIMGRQLELQLTVPIAGQDQFVLASNGGLFRCFGRAAQALSTTALAWYRPA